MVEEVAAAQMLLMEAGLGVGGVVVEVDLSDRELL